MSGFQDYQQPSAAELDAAYAAERGGPPSSPDDGRPDDESVRKVSLKSAADIPVRRARWLWEDRLPLGSLCLLAGREGLGKSTVALQLAADLTRGTLAGEFYGRPAPVFVVATEDSWPHTIVPRLMAAGAELAHVHRVDVHVGPRRREVEVPADLAALTRLMGEHRPAMVLLDPLLSRLERNLDSHKDADVRRALEPLTALADETEAVVLGLVHLNKASGTEPLDRLMGSRAFPAVARAILFVIEDPADDGTRLLGQPKNNLGRIDLPTLAFRLEVPARPVAHTDDGAVWATRVRWVGDRDSTIRELLEIAADAPDVRTAVDDAAEWLAAHLSDRGGCDDSATVKRGAHTAGHSLSALHRARQRLRVVTENQNVMPRRTLWILPGTAAEPAGRSAIPVTPRLEQQHD